MTIKLSLKKHRALNISFTIDTVFLLKPDKDEPRARTRLATTRNACPAMPANTSSRKSFTQRDYVRSSTDGVGIDLYSRQDTRIYHYPYAWEAFAHICTRTRAPARTRSREPRKENSRIAYTHGMSCPDWHRSCLFDRYVGAFLSPLLGFVDTLALWPFAILRAFSRPMTLQSHGQQCALPSPTRYSFFPPIFAGLGSRAKPGACHAKPVAREEKQAPRTGGRYFHPNARQSATLVYVPRLSAP